MIARKFFISQLLHKKSHVSLTGRTLFIALVRNPTVGSPHPKWLPARYNVCLPVRGYQSRDLRELHGKGTMPTDVVMPQMGESIFEGTITKWLKKAGDRVQRDEPLFEISTDKVDAEIPAPASGVLQEIKVSEGSTVQVNTVVGVIGDGNGLSASASAKAAAPAPAAATSASAKKEATAPPPASAV